ncbi:MAG: bifunctional diaminohydroxyphosphoribosylaminopyrimidine deaminase/5-amino-6-(5-phosphoribosylamino)uracil reductase RibD, partial [Flavobacteriales bacterium]
MSRAGEKYMKRCIQLAKCGKGNCAPNPIVGCVIVYNDRIIGEGFHREYGKDHAEVYALNNVKKENKKLLKDSTLYLEPCSIHKNTPPCTELIINSGIKNVVIGCQDPNPAIAGKGLQKLKDNGLDVTSEVLKEECEELNRRFITFHTKKRPYIILKWAQTPDGFIDKKRDKNQKGMFPITGNSSNKLVHKWRSEEQAILTGINTVLNDNPQLTVRKVAGNNPIRIIFDPELKISSDHSLFKEDGEVIIINNEMTKIENNISFIKAEKENPINTLFSVAIDKGITSILI